MPKGYGAIKRGLEPKSHPNVLDIAWASGIYEGEGNCRSHGNPGTTEQVVIGQKDRWILDKLQSLFGGSVLNSGSDIYRWGISGTRARGFLLTIFTFLLALRR